MSGAGVEVDGSRGRRLFLRTLLGCCALLIALGLVSGPAPMPVSATQASSGDAALYRAIDRRVAASENYYRAAAAEQRARGFPLRPFVTVRLPTRSWLFAAIGDRAALVVLYLLGMATIVAFGWRLREATPGRPAWSVSVALAVATVLPLANPVVALWPDLWAGLLIALSLTCRRQRSWPVSIALGLLAAAFRELAILYLGLMVIVSWRERDGSRREAFGWLAAGMIALVGVAAHAHAVHGVLLPGDHASQGWLRAGGWPFDLSIARATTLLLLAPAWVAAIVVPVALLGWFSARGRFAADVRITLAGFLLPFLVIGRPENAYWGLLIAPLLLAGMPLALPALASLRRG